MSRDFRPLADYDALTTLAHLSSLVGHHLINSFSAIVNNTEVLRLMSGTDDALESEEILDRIIRNAIEASMVARKMIDLVRPATRPGNSEVELNSLIKNVVAEFRAAVSPSIGWELHLGTIPPIQGNPDELLGMFRSLLSNSVEAIGEREGTISIRSDLDDRSWIVVDITDNGIGMDSTVVDHAVTPFFTTKPDHLGIGLSVASSVWRRHRGSLSVRSRAGLGTTILMTLDTGPDRFAHRPPDLSAVQLQSDH